MSKGLYKVVQVSTGKVMAENCTLTEAAVWLRDNVTPAERTDYRMVSNPPFKRRKGAQRAV